jgi:hypothetical protein
LAAVPLKPRKPVRRHRKGKRSGSLAKTGKTGRRLLVLAFILGIVLSVLYIPWRLEYDSNYSRSALITEKSVEGISSLKLITVKELASVNDLDSAVVFVDLKDDWPLLPSVLSIRRPVILTGISPYTTAELARLLDYHLAYTGYLEFDERGAYVKEALKSRELISLVFRVHNLKRKEYPNYDIEAAVTRYLRAVRERSIDALLFLLPEIDFDYDTLVRETYESLGKFGFLGEDIESPRVGTLRYKLIASVFLFMLIFSYSPLLSVLVLPLWVLLPVIGLPAGVIAGQFSIYYGLSAKVRREFIGVLLFFSMSLFLGLAANSAMIGPAYQNGLEVFRGVKLSLVALPGWLFIRGIMKSTREKFSKADILLIVLVVLGAIYYVLRSGNFSVVLSIERRLRDILDSLMLVRPRFKEIIAYPLLAISVHNGFSIRGKLSPIVIAGGSISVVSVVNTFCHATVPIWTGLLRSAYGLAIGLLFLIVYLTFFKRTHIVETATEEPLNPKDRE